MEKYFALVKHNVVQTVIVANDDFLHHVASQYDHIVDVTNMSRPAVDDSYCPDTNTFMSGSAEVHELPVDLNADHVKQGTEVGFESFRLSKYMVSYEDGMVKIGCKKYSLPGFKDALHKVMVNKQAHTSCFTTATGKPSHGKFNISWEDAQKLYDVLMKVKS